MFSQSLFRQHVDRPTVFVTDDEALVQVLELLTPASQVENALGAELTGDSIFIDGLDVKVHDAVRAYMDREKRRVLMHSHGIAPKVKLICCAAALKPTSTTTSS